MPAEGRQYPLIFINNSFDGRDATFVKKSLSYKIIIHHVVF